MKLIFTHTKSTKTCEVYQYGESPNAISLYLKKDMIAGAGFRPDASLRVSIEEEVSDDHDD